MTVTVLLENKSGRADCGCAHGLSLHIATKDHQILFDTGPNELFLDNAKALGVDLTQVDLGILSHGHYDHGGGLVRFFALNDRAVIYAHSEAFLGHAVQKDGAYQDIGVDPQLPASYPQRFSFAQGEIAKGLTLFFNPQGEDFVGQASKSLLEKSGEAYMRDPFRHEQNLLVECEGRRLLFAGCAHRGIVNILRSAEQLAGGEIDWVFAGFHLTNPGLGIDEPRELVEAVGKELLQREKTRYVTGHCTGDGPYDILQKMLGERLIPMPTGSVFTL